jgi:hypothetical protein
MAGVRSTSHNGQWGVAGINAGVGLLVLILVAVLALVVNPPAPPGIAAFAPQANKPITKAPLSQSAQFGDGDGACAAGQTCEGQSLVTTTTTPKGKPRGVPSSLQCYTWPDGSVTQTFDPQSPPCVATWDDSKGNGGATSRGVTTSEIRVALPEWGTQPQFPYMKPLVDFFNTRFQFYGRKITIVPVNSQQVEAQATGTFHQPAMQRADATQIANSGVFASHDFVIPLHYSWSLPVFRDTLYRAKIVQIHGGEMVPYGSAGDLAAHAPYEWTYLTPIEGVMRNVATMACRQLVDKQATHAGDATLRTKTRKFALMFPTDNELGGPMPGLDTLLNVLAGCGVSSPRVIRYNYADRQQPATTTAALRDLQSDGVTSIVWFPFAAGGTPKHPWSSANSINYHPEWVMVGWHNYAAAFEASNPASEVASAFGVGVWNKYAAPGLEMWERAFVAAGGDPSVVSSGLVNAARPFYNELLLLASGIQMAGPNLTPESFARGLHATKFPNPGAGGPPFYQGTVGFGAGDITMVDDMNAFWLDTRVPGNTVSQTRNNNTSQFMCYANNGRRSFLNTWPTVDAFYEPGVCR